MKTRFPAHLMVSVLLAAAVLGAGGVGAWYLIVSRKAPPERPSRTIIPKVEAPPLAPLLDYRVEIVGYGSARPKVRAELSPLVSGEVIWKADNFLPGKYVEKDQVLFRIDPNDSVLARDGAAGQLALHEAQLARLVQEEKNLQKSRELEDRRLKLAEKSLRQVRELRDRQAVAENDLDAAEDQFLARQIQLRAILDRLALLGPQRDELSAQIQIDRTKLRQAEIDLARATFRSPVTGRILQCSLEVGERVQVGHPCGEVYGIDVMEVPVSVPAGDLRWLDADTIKRCHAATQAGDDEHRCDAEVRWTGPGNGEVVSWKGGAVAAVGAVGKPGRRGPPAPG